MIGFVMCRLRDFHPAWQENISLGITPCLILHYKIKQIDDSWNDEKIGLENLLEEMNSDVNMESICKIGVRFALL